MAESTVDDQLDTAIRLGYGEQEVKAALRENRGEKEMN